MKVKGRRTGYCYAGIERTVKRAYYAGRIVVLCVAACLLMSSCQGVRKEEEKKSIRIGISLYRGDDTFINNIRSIIEEKAKEYERESGIKVTLDIQEAKGSQNTQNNQVERFIERFIALGCDVLCINPVDRMDTSLIIDKAMTAGVPVVFFNRQPVEEDMNRWDKLFYVGVDAKETAVLQGKMVVDLYRKQPEAGLKRRRRGELRAFGGGKQPSGFPDPHGVVRADAERRRGADREDHRRDRQLGAQSGVGADGAVAYRVSGYHRAGDQQQ